MSHYHYAYLTDHQQIAILLVRLQTIDDYHYHQRKIINQNAPRDGKGNTRSNAH